ncbi:hypothetical protein ACLOJK_020681 [Asimina triloba]
MASSSWMKCLEATVYIVLATALAAFAIYSAYQFNKTQEDASSPTNSSSSSSSSCPAILSAQLTLALRSSGYNLVADILQKSPQCLLPPPEGTLFAIPDLALHQILLPAPAKRDLLRYHISPKRLVFEDLLQLPPRSCLPTFLGRKNLSITKTDPEERTVDINRTPVSDPDIYTDGPYAVHGILAPFYSPGPEEGRFFAEGALIPESSCDASSGVVAEEAEGAKREEAVEWPHILHLLSWNGFLSFSIGLQSVLEGIVRGCGDLSSVTVFAPRECDLSCFPLPPKLLEQRIMLHILPRRVSYADLALLPEKALLQTLLPGQDLQITIADGFAHMLSINGVEVVAPDIVATGAVVIHGISRAFENIKIST